MKQELEKESDENLMVLYQNGNYSAFETLYHRHSARVFGYFCKKLSSIEEAEDLAQKSFAKLHLYRSRYSPKYPFLPWLFTVCRTQLVDFYRKHKTVSLEAEEMERLPALEQVEKEDSSAKVKALLEKLPKEQRELLEMKYLKELSFEEMADELGSAAQTLRKRISRMVKKLKEELK